MKIRFWSNKGVHGQIKVNFGGVHNAAGIFEIPSIKWDGAARSEGFYISQTFSINPNFGCRT